MWYDLGQTLTYNCLFNFVIGSRGVGKTYALKKRAVKMWIEKKQQFVYLRRYNEELETSCDNYFNDIITNNEYPQYIIKYVSGEYKIKHRTGDEELDKSNEGFETFGYAMALTKAKDYKSSSFPLVYLIIFDEFLIEDNGYTRYLKNEVKQFLNFYMSIDRYRGCIVFFLANSVTMVNPYTIYFNLQLPYGKDIVRKGDVLLQIVNNQDYIENRKQTRFGKMIAGTDFEQYAIENKFTNDSKTFVMKKTEGSRYYFTFIYNEVSYGVWIDYKEGKLFVSENIDPSCRLIYSITVSDHSPNTLLLKSINKAVLFKTFIDNYKLGNVYFESIKIKQIVYEVIRLTMNI